MESNTQVALEQRFGWPDGAKLALERRSMAPSWRWNGVWIALARRFGRPGSQVGSGTALEAPLQAKLALEMAVHPERNRRLWRKIVYIYIYNYIYN